LRSLPLDSEEESEEEESSEELLLLEDEEDRLPPLPFVLSFFAFSSPEEGEAFHNKLVVIMDRISFRKLFEGGISESRTNKSTGVSTSFRITKRKGGRAQRAIYLSESASVSSILFSLFFPAQRFLLHPRTWQVLS